MPVLNEARYLRAAVEGILAQRYDGEMEVVLAVAPSRDATHDIAGRLAAEDPRVRVVGNPTGRTPRGLNAAIAASTHPVVVRVDGHGVLPDGYVRTAVKVLQETGADNVGGMMVPEGSTAFEQAVACAMSSRVGIGGGRFHVGGDPGPAETVFLGVFRRDTLERLGGFDETFTRAQDWELNYRIRRSGGLVWFTPDLRVSYRPRSTLRALATQFFHTGQWRRQVMQRYPETASARFLAPPAAVVLLAVGTVGVALAPLVGMPALAWGALAPAGYTVLLVGAAAVTGRGLPGRARAWLPAVIATMHLAWGGGFLCGPGRGP
jgi:glycosyltransferase involved in cell wall biosynthesis